MAPMILIFSMAMGADYAFELIFNETCAPQFNGHNTFFLASVLPVDLLVFLLLVRGEAAGSHMFDFKGKRMHFRSWRNYQKARYEKFTGVLKRGKGGGL